ncbi:exocyst complex component EXO70A [Populus alba x Populus x berolinensis]|uniref:Exocyst subunit Exo70 family protein n=1 Tax=Populus alba x Populus x berolinensis TaxID=444605 RepID=A0AAD6LRW5_9ROSI|nr:exocyst complex component EXO70A [Populus alba x Populus x berolinensis]
MNTYWYIYMRTRNTELGKLLGEQCLKMNYKVVAEESAYMYQMQAWKPLVRLLDKEELKRENKSENEDTRALIREKMEGFLKGVSEVSQRHRSGSYTIHDVDLREQIKEATVKLVVPAYIEFLNAYSSALPSKSYVKPEAVHGLFDQIFNGSHGKLKRRDSKHRTRGGTSSSFDVESKDLRRLGSYTSDM